MANTIVGSLCPRGHDHEGSGGSLRYVGGSCVECAKARHVAKRLSKTPEQREDKREYMRVYRERHSDEIKAQTKVYRETNRDRIKPRKAISNKKYRENHLDTIKERSVIYRSTEHAIQLRKARTRNRRALLTNAGTHTAAETNHRLRIFNSVCAYCGDDWEHIDHIVPLHLGGDNTMINLAPACSRCNLSKGGKMLEDWYPEQPFFDNARYDCVIGHSRPEFQEARGKESKVSLCESLFDFV